MTRRHFRRIARIIAKNLELYRTMPLDKVSEMRALGFREGARHAIWKVKVDLEQMMADENELFDKEKFRGYIAEMTR